MTYQTLIVHMTMVAEVRHDSLLGSLGGSLASCRIHPMEVTDPEIESWNLIVDPFVLSSVLLKFYDYEFESLPSSWSTVD